MLNVVAAAKALLSHSIFSLCVPFCFSLAQVWMHTHALMRYSTLDCFALPSNSLNVNQTNSLLFFSFHSCECPNFCHISDCFTFSHQIADDVLFCNHFIKFCIIVLYTVCYLCKLLDLHKKGKRKQFWKPKWNFFFEMWTHVNMCIATANKYTYTHIDE